MGRQEEEEMGKVCFCKEDRSWRTEEEEEVGKWEGGLAKRSGINPSFVSLHSKFRTSVNVLFLSLSQSV